MKIHYFTHHVTIISFIKSPLLVTTLNYKLFHAGIQRGQIFLEQGQNFLRIKVISSFSQRDFIFSIGE